MATLTVTASHDYSNETLSNITTIEFREPGQFDSALVKFSPLQFDDVQISSSVHFSGTGASDFHRIIVDAFFGNGSGAIGFSAANWTFDGDDYDITINGSSAGDFIIGSGRDDTIDGRAGADILAGGGGNDVIDGGDGDDNIDGGSGVDSIKGGLGADTIAGGDGNDFIDGGAHADTLVGGSGDDVFQYTSMFDVVAGESVDGGDGKDTISLRNFSADYDLSSLTLNNVEELIFVGTATGGSVTLNAAQFIFTHIFIGFSTPTDLILNNASSTNLSAVTGNLTGRLIINGTSADDSLTGSRFQDFINGGSGADALAGGLGNDSYILQDVHRTDPTLPLFAYDQVTEAPGEGTDTVYVQRAGIVGRYTLANNVENGTITGGDTFTLFGNSLDNLLLGNSAANTLAGGSGNDTLNGAAGADTLIGELGFDALTGGPGADKFVLDGSALVDAQATIPFFDRITDYDQGDSGAINFAEGDQLDLSALLSAALQSGQPISSLIQAIEVANSAMFRINPDGRGFVTIAQLDGLHVGDSINVILDASQPVGTSVTVLPAPASSNPPPPPGTTADMILRRGADGRYEIYDIGNNSLLAAYPLGQVGIDWQYIGLGGFFGSDTTDMLLRNSGTGGFEVYDVANNNITGAAFLGTVGLDWLAMGFGNFSSLGETDMLLRNVNTGGLEVYDIRNNHITDAAFMGTVGLDWQFSGVGNFSSRGESDLLLRNANTGGLEVYDINSNQITGAAFIGTIGLDWQFSGVGNFSGVPGETDLLLRNVNTGGLEVYNIANNQLTGAAFIGTIGLEWQYAGIAPVHAPGASDLILRNVNTGQFEVYDIAGNQLVGAASLGTVGLDWQLGGFAVDPPTAPMGSSEDSTSQLVQAMAGFGGGAADSSNALSLGADTSQQTFLTTPHA